MPDEAACASKPGQRSKVAGYRLGHRIGPGAARVSEGSARSAADPSRRIEFARDGDNPGLDIFHVHIKCFAAWELERNKPDGHRSPS